MGISKMGLTGMNTYGPAREPKFWPPTRLGEGPVIEMSLWLGSHTS